MTLVYNLINHTPFYFAFSNQQQMSNRKMSNRSFVSNSYDSLFDIISSDFDIQHLENASVEEKRPLKSFSRDFAAKYTNFCSNEEIQGTFTIYRDFLVCNKVKKPPLSLKFNAYRANCLAA